MENLGNYQIYTRLEILEANVVIIGFLFFCSKFRVSAPIGKITPAPYVYISLHLTDFGKLSVIQTGNAMLSFFNFSHEKNSDCRR